MQKRRISSKRRWGVGLGAVGVFVLGIGTASVAEIRGTKHDFTHAAWSGGDACLPCHVPHKVSAPKKGLWEAQASPIKERLYKSARSSPGPLSLACLSCHDGNTAPDTFGVGLGEVAIPARSRIGAHGSLSTDHPVGVRYPVRARDFRPVGAATASGCVRVFDGKVECSSCHDPHNSFNQDYLLVMDNRGSNLCLSCHDK